MVVFLLNANKLKELFRQGTLSYDQDDHGFGVMGAPRSEDGDLDFELVDSHVLREILCAELDEESDKAKLRELFANADAFLTFEETKALLCKPDRVTTWFKEFAMDDADEKQQELHRMPSSSRLDVAKLHGSVSRAILQRRATARDPSVLESRKSASRDKKNLKLLVTFIGMLGIVAGTAYLLRELEKDQEIEDWTRFQAILTDYQEALNELHNETQIQRFRALYDFMKDEGCGHFGTIEQRNWSWSGSLYFVMTIVSTVGYGTFVAKTSSGKAVTALLAVFGVGYFAYLLTLLSERIIKLLQMTVQVCLCKPRSYRLGSRKTLVLLIIASLLYILGLAILGHAYTSWGFGNSIYAAVITFTTVGLGDYAPEFQSLDPSAARIFGPIAGCLALIGVALLSAIVGGIQQVIADLRLDEFLPIAVDPNLVRLGRGHNNNNINIMGFVNAATLIQKIKNKKRTKKVQPQPKQTNPKLDPL